MQSKARSDATIQSLARSIQKEEDGVGSIVVEEGGTKKMKNRKII
jgi:hypothetical protein